MDADTWSRLRPILEGASEHEGAAREAFVRTTCGEDAQLAKRALEYLAAGDDPDGVLADASPLGQCAAAAAGLAAPGTRFGPWRLESELGRGGMGSVWLATRADEAFEKYVALKLIPDHLGGPELLARFEREQRLLASLDHPGIARLIDAGHDDGGRPFLVMEYVEGQPIDTWCSARGLDLHARLELFREVCAAVEYAHRKLVVHRDLKPANILVARDGHPKLLDFGIARMLEGDSDLTRTGEARFTPHYASLEQVRGEVIGTQSDVYSLGVILFELLCGERPYRFETGAPTEILHMLGEVDPRPPSSVAGTTRGLAGDLDAIVLCAMRREPERRYGSVAAFSDDIGRYLDGLPVTAQPDTVRYRTAKFLRRHGLSVGAVAVLVLALAGGLAGTTHQYLRAEDARAAEIEQTQLALARAAELEQLAADLQREHASAEQHFEEVRRFATALVFDVERTLQQSGSTRAREKLITLGLEHLDQLAESAGGDETLRAELAAAYLQMGDVLGARVGLNLGRTNEAVAAYRKALVLLDGAPDASALEHEGWPLVANAEQKLADALIALGRPAEAERALERAMAQIEGLAAEPDASDRDLVMTSRVISLLRILATEAGRLDDAERLLQDELELTARLLERHPQKPAALDSRSASLVAAANLAQARHENDRAREYFEQACVLLEQATSQSPSNVGLRRGLCVTRVALAEALLMADEAEEARWLLEETVEWTAELVGANDGDQQLQRDLTVALLQLGKVQLRLGADAEALDSNAASLELAESTLAREPDNVDLHSIAAMAGLQKARALIRLGQPAEARSELRQSAQSSEQVLKLAPGDPQRRRAVIVNCLELGKTALHLEAADLDGLKHGRTTVDRGLQLLGEAQQQGIATPLDAEIERQLQATSDTLDERLAAAAAS